MKDLAAEGLKRSAAAAALELVESGMRLGLGTGSTVAHFLELLGERVRGGAVSGVVGVPTSERTARQARQEGIELGSLQSLAPLDLTVDGADEVAPDLDLIKGLGAALLREKLVASASRRLVIVADESKRVTRLGEKAPVPVEVVPFAWEVHLDFFADLGADPTLRTSDGVPLRTDNGNHVIDCRFPEAIPDPHALDRALRDRVGVVEHGLFLGLAERAFVAGPDGVAVVARGP